MTLACDRRGAIALAIAAMLSACARQGTASTARPALWRAVAGPRVCWLFGTIHLVPPALTWRSPALDRAIAACDTLITEIPPGDPQAQAAVFLRLARARGLPPVLARVPEPQRAALAGAARQAGMPLAALDRLATWAAALTLTSASAKAVGATATNAPETVLAGAFADRPRAALETFAGQLGIFAGLPEAAQRQLLAAAVEGIGAAESEFRMLLTAWTAGDLRAIERTFLRSFAGAPALRQALLIDRNRAWADALARRPAGAAFVAVGAGHMVGSEGLPALMSARGFRVARMQ